MSVHVALKNEKGKNEITCVERLSSITFEKTLIKSVDKKNSSFLKKFSTFEMKNILHPRKISVKCYIFFYLFITSNSPILKRKYISKYFSIFCETFSNVVVACPFRGTCLQPVKNIFSMTFHFSYTFCLHRFLE